MVRSQRPARTAWTSLAVVLGLLAALAFPATATADSLGGFTGVGAPSVTGTGAIGTTFTASFDTTGVTPTPTSIDYTWHQADGGALLQTGGTTYTATSALLGESVYVIATLHAPDTTDYTTTNSPFSTTIHLAEFTPGASPQLGGPHTIGGTLTASLDVSGWNPTPTGVAWQWYLEDGTILPGESARTIELTSDLVGEVVYAVATVSAADTQSYVIATAPSGKIASITIDTDQVTTVKAGGTVPVKLWGLLPLTEYQLQFQSTPVELGTFMSTADGTLSTTIAVPAGAAPGTHHIVAMRDGVAVASAAITVTAAGTLASTGPNNAQMLGAAGTALAVIAAGAALLIAGRKRSGGAQTVR